jgi:hypothetical protein
MTFPPQLTPFIVLTDSQLLCWLQQTETALIMDSVIQYRVHGLIF